MAILDLRLLLSHPDWVWTQAKEHFRRKFSLKWNYWVGQSVSNSPPAIVALRLNPSEILDNVAYGQFGSFALTASTREHRKEIFTSTSLENLKKIADEAASVKAKMFIWGSEPLEHPEVLPLIEHIKEQQIYCQIMTRGSMLNSYAEKIVEWGVDELIICLDGPRQVYKSINPRSHVFDDMEAGVKAITSLRKKMKKKKPLIRGNTVITPDNYHYLDETRQILEELGFDTATFAHIFSVSEAMGQSFNRFFLDTFNSTADSWQRLKINTSGMEISALIREMMRLKSRSKEVPVDFFPALKAWQISDFYKTPDFSAGIDRCQVPWFIANVLENGNIVPCVDYPDLAVGNMRDDTLLSIWNNEEMKHFRTELVRYGKFPVCSKCSGLYRL
jgi:radical SAM protein with 4Fe4S-binding SPASM domain